MEKTVRQEVNRLLKPNTTLPLCSKVDIPSIEEFSWDQTLEYAQKNAPLFHGVLKSAVTTKANETTLMKGKTVNLKPKLGTAMACLLNAKAPKKAAFIPTLLSIQFWRGRLNRESIHQLSKMGICVGYATTLSAVDKIRKDFDTTAKICKSNIETQLMANADMSNMTVVWNEDLELSQAVAATVPNIEDEINEPSDNEETILYYPEARTEGTVSSEEDNENESDNESENESDSGESDKSSSSNENAEDEEIVEDMSVEQQDEHVHPGFTLCWDNVGKKVTSRHPGVAPKNKYINMALGYLAINRVPSTNLDWQFDQNLKRATDLSFELYMPNQNDFKAVKTRLEIIVGRIISRHLPFFKDNFNDCSIPHIVHNFSAESSHRSVLCNLGVFDVDPSSTQGAISIYETLQQYVPSIHGTPYTTIVYGDGLSCERGNDAHKARSNGLNPWERLEGCQPGAQEFHKEMLLLQDFYDLFFKGSSSVEKGTLSHLKNIFNFRQVKADISDNFTYAWELMCLMTEGFVCLLAMTILGMEEKENRPTDAEEEIENASFEQRNVFFKDTCESIVQKLWFTLNTNALGVDDGTGPPVFCCGEDIDDDTIACEAGSNCDNGEIFHYMCAEIDPNNVPRNWFCSDQCRNRTAVYPYCNCHIDLGMDEPMIGCSAETECLGNEWYHMKCVGFNEDNAPTGDWYCQEACKPKKRKGKKGKKKSKKDVKPVNDTKYNYSRALCWFGLNLLCRRDAVREADGEAMMSHWRIDLVHFFRTKHPKYLILAHRLIASINGWLPEKLRHDLIHNRTVNYGGGIGRNLPMDFMNEILNRLFKDLLDSAKGRYTNTTIQRCSQIVGPLGEALDGVFDSKVVENELYRHRRRHEDRDKNVEELISLLSKENLFDFIPGRTHKTFPDFQFTENPRNAGQFIAKMTQLNKKLDKIRRVVLNEV